VTSSLPPSLRPDAPNAPIVSFSAPICPICGAGDDHLPEGGVVSLRLVGTVKEHGDTNVS
jgi:hypothetical protein